jgi:hypothetical protein
MKKRFAISGLPVSLLVLVLAFVSCSNGSTDDEVDAKWQGRYTTLDDDYADVGASSLSYSIPGATGTIDKLSMGSGGEVKNGNNVVIGTWAYVRSEGEEFGFFMEITSDSSPGIYCGLGNQGVRSLVERSIETFGGSFTPATPSVSVANSAYFWGKKQ